MLPGKSLSALGLMAVPALQGLRAMSVCGISLENETNTSQPLLKLTGTSVCHQNLHIKTKLEVWGRLSQIPLNWCLLINLWKKL